MDGAWADSKLTKCCWYGMYECVQFSADPYEALADLNSYGLVFY